MTLLILSKLLQGCDSVLPIWREPLIIVKPYEACTGNLEPHIGTKSEIKMPDGSNIKKFIVDTIEALQTVLLRNVEDDIKSLFLVIQVRAQIFTNLGVELSVTI